MGARLIINLEKLYLSLKKLDLYDSDLKDYYSFSHKLGIVPKDLNKLQNKLFGIECNYEELNGIDFKKGCFIGQENTARIKLKNKLSKRLFPINILDGTLYEGEIIYNNEYELLVDKLERLLAERRIKKVDISAVGGPCLAAGLANRVHSSVVIANKDIQTAKKIADMLNTNYYHTSYSDDLNGVEVSAAIKNIFSMAVGAAKGLCSKNISNEVREKNYLNTASALIKQSIHEMEIFVEHLKGKKETVKGLAGLGDLYVSSGGGRNAKMGSYIGEGLTFSEAKKTKMEKVTVEGADLAKEIAKKVNEDFDEKKLPLMLGMINAIVDDKKLELDWESFR